MSKCDIEIEFDQADRTYCPGQSVSGKVHVTVNKDVACDAVVIEDRWRTHGRGNRTGETLETITFPGEQLREGDRKSYDFAFEAPEGPLTYHGHYLNVDHTLRASVDIPWALDPKAKEDYLLVPGPDAPASEDAAPIDCRGQTSKGHVIGMVVMTVIATVLSVMFRPYGALAWLLVVIMVFKAVRNSLAARKLGAVSFRLPSRFISPNQPLDVTVKCTPPMRTAINGITARLRAREIVVSGSGTNRSTHTKTIHDETFSLCETHVLDRGPQEIAGQIIVPDIEAWTFSARDNDLKWTLDLRVDISGCPDWMGSTEVDLVPGTC